jgi:hypothetical protein
MTPCDHRAFLFLFPATVQSRTMYTHTRPRWTFYVLAAILLLASYLRIHDLNAQGMWGDEGWSIWLARGDTVRDLTMTMVVDHHGPVYSMMLRAWALVAGEPVVALRMLTVLFSISSIALLYRLGRELFNPAGGVWAALAFALMDKHVVLTQEVRDYPMVFFTMIGIAYFYVRWRRSPRGGNAFGFVLFSVFGLYLHYYCYMVNLAILAHAALTLRERARWRHFLALNALITVAFLPWTVIVVHQFVNTPVDAAVLTIHGMPFNKQTLEYLASESLGNPLALYGLLMLAGWVGPLLRQTPGPMARVPRDKRLSGALLAVLWFGIPIIITWALHSRYPLLTDRNISVILPAIALLVGFGITAFERFGAAWIVTLVVVNGLLVTSSYFVKHPWNRLAADVAANYADNEPVLEEVGGEHAALWYHLLLALPDQDIPAILNRLPEEATENVISLYDYRHRYKDLYLPHLKAVLDQTDGLWMAYWGDEAVNNDTLDLIEQEGFVRTGRMDYQHHGSPIYALRYDRLSSLEKTIARFGDSITLHKADWSAAGDGLNVRLWWQTDTPVGLDYSVSVFLLDTGGIVRSQHDGFPARGTAPTSSWTPGQFVFDGHTLDLADLPPGDYSIGVKLYTYWDGAILQTAGGEDYAILGTFTMR